MQAILCHPVKSAPNLDGKHARWWNNVHGSAIREVDVVYRAKHNSCHADALSQQPVLSPPLEDDSAEVQVVLKHHHSLIKTS